jgi:hypothetical protein
MFPNLMKIQSLLAASSTTSAQTATAQLDTLGHDFVSIGVIFASAANGTNPHIALTVGEADVTNTSSATNITPLVGGGVGGFTLPVGPTATGTPNVFQFDIDLRHRQRYLLVSATPFTTCNVAVVASLGNPEQGPLAATTDNLLGRVGA